MICERFATINNPWGQDGLWLPRRPVTAPNIMLRLQSIDLECAPIWVPDKLAQTRPSGYLVYIVGNDMPASGLHIHFNRPALYIEVHGVWQRTSCHSRPTTLNQSPENRDQPSPSNSVFLFSSLQTACTLKCLLEAVFCSTKRSKPLYYCGPLLVVTRWHLSVMQKVQECVGQVSIRN